MSWKPTPLPSTFLLTAIIGFLVSALWVLPMSLNWGVTFIIFFGIMVLAAVVSMHGLAKEEEKKLDIKPKKRR